MNSEPSLSPTVKRSTRTKDNDRDHSANAASASATAGPEPARNSSVQQHIPAENLAAAALQAAADAAATAADAAATAAKCDDPEVLRAVLRAAATTANALRLAQAASQDTVPTLVQGRPRLGGRRPEPGHAKPGGPHRHISANSHRHYHSQTASMDPASNNRQQPPEGRTKSPPADRSIYHRKQQPRCHFHYACDSQCPTQG